MKKKTLKHANGVLYYFIRILVVFIALIFVVGLYYVVTNKPVDRKNLKRKRTEEVLAEVEKGIKAYYNKHKILPPRGALAECLKWSEQEKGKLGEKGGILDGWERPLIYNIRSEEEDGVKKETGFILFSRGPNGNNDGGINDGIYKDDMVRHVKVPMEDNKVEDKKKSNPN